MKTNRGKGFKGAVAVALLPLCWGATVALGRVLEGSGAAQTFWVAALGGAASWLSVYLLLPAPMRLYVFGHELTHALWTWLLGGRVKRLRVSAQSGYVVTTRGNFLVTLAPYFFPIYAAGVAVVYGAGDLLWGWSRHRVWFHLALGAAYMFHLTLTWQVLRTRQSDLASQGYLFSAVVIWLGNVGVLLCGIPLLTGRIGVPTALGWSLQETGSLLLRLGAGARALAGYR